MFSETFNVRPWLEVPAKWLRWAMQSLTARNSTDVRYNLQQLWTTLAQAKTQATTQQDWSEVLTLDAQSQWTLGSLYLHDASDVLKQINDYSLIRNLTIYTDPIAAAAALLGVNDPALAALRTKLDGLNQSSKAAFDAQVSLAAQAAQAAQAANVPSQATATLTVGQKASQRSASEAAFNNKQAASMSKPPNPLDDLANAAKSPLLGIPMWAWLAGGVLLLLLITTRPSIAQAAAIRRAVED